MREKKVFEDWILNGSLIEEGSHSEKINNCERSVCFVSLAQPSLGFLGLYSKLYPAWSLGFDSLSDWVKIQYEFGFEWGLFDSDDDWKVSIILKENILCQSFSCSPRHTMVHRFDKQYEQKLILFWSNSFCWYIGWKFWEI